jgi:type IV pilus assembly protein PilV
MQSNRSHCQPKHLHTPVRRHARGLTLIEVLVTMVLLGVGLLGLAGLQLRGMQVSQGSTFRSEAAILAEDMADRLRADATTAAAHGYDGSWSPNGPIPNAAVQPLLVDWLYRMNGLPSGCVNVNTQVPLNPSEIVITVTWDDTRAARAANAAATAAANAACTPGQGNGSYILTTE